MALRTYIVNVGFTASFDFKVRATSRRDAKHAAWDKFRGTKRPRKYTEFDIERVERCP